MLSRYGRLTGRDLEVLSHGEQPWQDADRRRTDAGKETARISAEVMTQYFAADADDEVDVDAAELKVLLAGADERRRSAANQPDDLDRLRRRLLEWQQTARRRSGILLISKIASTDGSTSRSRILRFAMPLSNGS